MSSLLSPHLALQRFGFRQGLKGSLIIGLLVGFMVLIQGYGYAESYPDKASQEKFAQEMSSVPSLGILYGSNEDLTAGAPGYVVYRVVAFMSLIIAVWGLMAITKILRGNEEDGRWEVIRTGNVTSVSSTFHVVIGFFYAFLLSFTVGTLGIILITSLPAINMSLQDAILVSCALYAPALVFIGVGVFVSQLAITRRRALLYGLIPLLFAYFIRSIGNINTDYQSLLYFTPFGWNMLINPVLAPQPWWLVPAIISSVVFLVFGVMLAKRDLGSSIINESTTATSRFFLLGSPWQLALRQNIWVYVAWSILALAMGAIVASILDVATNATAGSSVLSQSVEALAGTSHDLRLAFLGAGIIFVVLVLLIMATVLIGSIRNDEAKQYLDTILVQPKTRSMWLVSRLILGIVIVVVISFATMALTYAAAPRDLPIEFAKMSAHSIAMVGSIILLMGVGTLLYGILPRLAVIAMYLIITWSFIIDLVSSVVTLNEIVLKSSLFHYMSFDLAKWPDWQTFGWLACLGIAMMLGGIYLFTKRDTVIE